MTRFGRRQTQPCLAALAKPLLPSLSNSTQLNSPTDALIDLNVRGRLGRFIPVCGWLKGFTGLRITVIPQRRPACRGDARRLCLCPDVIQYVADVGAVRDEGDDSHLPATQGAQQREHLVDSGNQHRLQVVRRALGWCRLHRCALCHLRDRSPVRRVRCQHTKVAMTVRARGRHQLGDTVDQLQWREVQFFACCTLPLEKPSAFGDKDIIHKLICASDGLTGKVTIRLSMAAELAIRQKLECITADLIDQAAASGTYKRRPADVESEM